LLIVDSAFTVTEKITLLNQQRSVSPYNSSVIGDMSTKKKKVSAEQRTVLLKQQLLAEELTVTDDLVQSLADGDDALDQSDIDDINQVIINHSSSSSSSVYLETQDKRKRKYSDM